MSSTMAYTSKRWSTRTPSTPCLFCARKDLCSGRNGVFLDVPGAIRCSELQKQLQNLFILRTLLDVSKSWCEETLKSSGTQPNSWFQICGGCFQLVEKAWELQQELLGVQTRLDRIKERLRHKIIESDEQTDANNRLGGFRWFRKIRGLFGTTEQEPPLEIDNFNGDGDDNANDGVDAHDDDFLPSESEGLDVDGECDDNRNTNFAMKIDAAKKFPKRKGFLMKRNASSWMRTWRARKRAGKSKLLRRVESKWICDMCPVKYKTENELSVHKEAHERSKLNNSEFTCSECNFPADDKTQLEDHVAKKHSRYYVCKAVNCGFRNLYYHKFEKHARETHPDLSLTDCGVESLECTECHQKLMNRSALVIHKKKMHPELFNESSKMIYQCDQCLIRFTSKIRLQYHIRYTHNRVMNFVCETCGKGFDFKKNLKHHEITHQKEKRDFVCHLCGCSYLYKSALNEHYRKFHPEQDLSNPGGNPTGDINLPEEEFKCKYCDLKSPIKVVIFQHEKTHIKEMGNQCELCNKCYANKAGLKRHMLFSHADVEQSANCPHCFKTFPNTQYMRVHARKYCKMKNIDEKLIQPGTTYT